jgi:hypothetical protein
MLGSDRPCFKVPPTPAKSCTASLTPTELVAVRQFVARVGGLENARRSLEMLALLSRTA